jgi:hypothetical protein
LGDRRFIDAVLYRVKTASLGAICPRLVEPNLQVTTAIPDGSALLSAAGPGWSCVEQIASANRLLFDDLDLGRNVHGPHKANPIYISSGSPDALNGR